MEFSKDIEKLKNLIIENERIDDILICTGSSYHVVAGSVVGFDDDYIFHFEGYSFHLELDEIQRYIILSE